MKIHYLQHVPFENPGIILDWAADGGHAVTCTNLYEVHTFPDLTEIDWLIIMGGPMNIYEEERYPWLKEEKAFIQTAVQADKLILGLCLGAQLIADVIGGCVIKNPWKEIGWFTVNLTEEAQKHPAFSFLPKRPAVFEWHGDTFVDLPAGTVSLASNEACQNQAFAYGDRIFGFQFHLENTWEIIANLMSHCADEMTAGQYIQTAEEITSQKHLIEQDNSWMRQFLSTLEQLQEAGER